MSKAGRGGKLVERAEKKYEMRFHLYMARFLPAKDENGLCDPYIVVKYYGQTLKSSVKQATCNPSWYETIVADVVVPEPVDLAPPITVLTLTLTLSLPPTPNPDPNPDPDPSPSPSVRP